MIKLFKADYEKMLEYAESRLPNEACGLIAGSIDGQDKVIKKVYFLTNTDYSNEHFTISPAEQFEAVRDMRANGLKPLGCWHSHPKSPAKPSKEDIRLAYDRSASYLILSLTERKKPVLNSFHISDGAAENEEVLIVC